MTDSAERLAVVTGANSGIGLQTALGLARRNFRVVMLCRDAARGKAAQRWLQQEAPGAHVDLLLADLSLLRNVRSSAASLRAYYGSVDVLINNAGVFTPRCGQTAEGHDTMVAVNYLAPFLLTLELLPLLRAAPQARIINVGSASSDRAWFDCADLQPQHGNGRRAYARSKLALLLFTKELARRLRDTGITVNCIHPGAVATRLGAVGGWAGAAWRVLQPFLMEPRRAAQLVLKLALPEELAPAWIDLSGQYLKPRGVARGNLLANNEELAARLWARSLQLTGVMNRQTVCPDGDVRTLPPSDHAAPQRRVR